MIKLRKVAFSMIVSSFVMGAAFAAGQGTLETAIFAGGCFWCMQPPFEKLEGVVSVYAGYTGGTGANPTYGDYAQKGHLEAVQVTFDPARISYAQLLDVFWRQIDPTDSGGQFCDIGKQYRSAIVYQTDAQKMIAQRSIREQEKSGRFIRPVVTELLQAGIFYKAEEYHQQYYKKHPAQYHAYRLACGRDHFLKKTWSDDMKSGKIKPAQEALKKQLTPLQYKVTQEQGTEPPFSNEYCDLHAEGIYVDRISGEPLFSSLDKYDSGTGWPSFTKPLVPGNIVEKPDQSLFTRRTEVKSRHADSHLGHVFNDGPKPTGLRYCMNSAALRFIPRKDLEKEGYGQYEKLFEARP